MELPTSFVERTKPLIGADWQLFVDALNEEPITSIRVNSAKTANLGLSYAKVPWCRQGYYLNKRPSFTFDPLFHAGAYYVQEASSMFLEQAINQYLETDVCVLDLCAAPGGKSSHLADLLSEGSFLVSNEVIRSRADILSENMTKSGHANVVVTNNDPHEIGRLTHCFDAILIDAPCSGEGMFRKDKNAVQEWSPANVQLCKERQQRIVADVWDALKPNGILIYSTCTYNKEENEDNVLWISNNLGAESLPLTFDSSWNVMPSYCSDVYAYHFFPHKTKGEGFFIAVLRKAGGLESPAPTKIAKKQKNQTKPEFLADGYSNYLAFPDRFSFFSKGEKWFAVPSLHYKMFDYISSKLRLVSGGICIGEFKGRDFIPHHSLAMSIDLNKNAFVGMTYEVDRDTAIAYLKKEAVSMPDMAKGYVLLVYEGRPLGFVKNIGNRANNLYPQAWRIRSTYSSGSGDSIL
ncbi:MAG: methyltransferase RsmF C-terminal domain-like protein [Dysgonomonas sp.]